MKRKILVDKLSDATGFSKRKCGDIVTAFGLILENELLAAGEVKIARLGTLFVKTLPARKGFDPYRQVHTELEPTNVVAFKPTARIKRLVKGEVYDES